MTTKHVCMIAYTNYSTDARVRREAETLAETGEFNVTFLSLMEGKTARSYVRDGVHVRELRIRKYRGKNRVRYILSYFLFLALAFLECAGRALTGKLDVAHVHNMPNFIVFAAIPAKCLGKKVILDIHDSVPETYLAKFSAGRPGILYKLLCMEERISCGIADRIICVNHPQIEALVRRGMPAGKIVVSMNVPDPRLFPKTAGKTGGGGKTIRIVYHGTITKRLGIDLAIRAVARLSKHFPDLRFIILGDGDDAAEFAALIQSLHAEETIRFENRMIPVEDLKAFLSDMDIGIVANRKNIDRSHAARKDAGIHRAGHPGGRPETQDDHVVLQRRHDLIFRTGKRGRHRRGDRGSRPVAGKAKATEPERRGVLRRVRLGKTKARSAEFISSNGLKRRRTA